MHRLENKLVQFIKSGFTLSYLLLCGNCVSPVEIPVDNVGGQLVISGQVSNIPEQNIIQLGLSADTERLPYPLSGAVVALIDDLGEYAYFVEDPIIPGSYNLQNAVGVPGRTYYLQIVTEGEVYKSIPERMPTSSGELATQFDFLNEEYTDLEGTVLTTWFMKVYANAVVPQQTEDSYLRWNVEEAFLLSPTDFPDPFGSIPPPCFVVQNADPQRIALFDGSYLQASTIDHQLICSRVVDWTFLEKHYFTSYQSSMTKEAFAYWEKINILANQVGSIFDTPPARIKGNVYNTNKPDEVILGYFQAVNQCMDRFFVHDTDVPFRITVTTCTYDGRSIQRYPARCLDCPSVRNSSYRRPDWF